MDSGTLINVPNIIPIIEKYNFLTYKISEYMNFAKDYDKNHKDTKELNLFIVEAGNYILDIMNHIEVNKELYLPYRKLKTFEDLVWILKDWKGIFENPDHILKTRKCILWIEKKY